MYFMKKNLIIFFGISVIPDIMYFFLQNQLIFSPVISDIPESLV